MQYCELHTHIMWHNKAEAAFHLIFHISHYIPAGKDRELWYKATVNIASVVAAHMSSNCIKTAALNLIKIHQ